MTARTGVLREIFRPGRTGTLLSAFFYFDVCCAIWVLHGAMAPFISQELGLEPTQKGLLLSVPIVAGALMRFPLGLLSQYIGRRNAAQVELGILALGLAAGGLLVDSLAGVIAMGVVLGVAGASFGVALSLGSGFYPPRVKGLAMGIVGAGNSGAALAVVLVPAFARAYGWRAVYGASIAPVVVAMVLLQVFAQEPPDQERKRLGDYLKLAVDRDAWVFNLLYMATFGGYIGLTSFLPTLFHDHYGIPKERIGGYAVGIVLSASVLRVFGGWLADRLGGIRLLVTLAGVIVFATAIAASMPKSPVAMVAILVACFSAMGAGSGAVFQLVPLRFGATTAVACSLIGEVGALAGGLLPSAMGLGKQTTGGFGPGFLSLTLLAGAVLVVLAMVSRRWTTSWVGAGGRAHGAPGSEASASRAAI